MDQREINSKASLNRMVLRGLERLKLIGVGIPPSSIKAGLMDAGTDADRENAAQFLDLLRLTDPDNIDPETMLPREGVQLYSEKLAKSPELVQHILKGSYEDFEGRGWGKTEAEEAGIGKPGTWSSWFAGDAYKASKGDRWVNEGRSDLNFAESLYNGDRKPTGNTFMDADLSGTGYVAPSREEQYEYERGDEGRVSETPKRAEGGLTLDEIGVALTDPNTTAGAAIHYMSDIPLSRIEHGITRKQGKTTLGDIANALSPNAHTPENAAATAEREAKYVSNRASTLHGKDFDNWRDKEASRDHLKGLHERLGAESYDDSYRSEYGQYPTYAGSAAVTLAENVPDFFTAISGGGNLAAKGLVGGLKAMPKALAKEMLLEDTPMVAGVMGAPAVAMGQVPTTLGGWTSRDRPDLPTENSQQFGDRVASQRQDRKDAASELKKHLLDLK